MSTFFSCSSSTQRDEEFDLRLSDSSCFNECKDSGMKFSEISKDGKCECLPQCEMK